MEYNSTDSSRSSEETRDHDDPTGSASKEGPSVVKITQTGAESTNEIRQAEKMIRAAPLAERETLSWWFPQINNDEKKSMRIWMSRRSRALMLQIIIASTIFLVNLGLTSAAVSRFPSQNGVGLIYSGDCDTVAKLDQWIHLLINVLSTGLLSASNYCMQLQAAPTRRDVDEAHSRNTWLDIEEVHMDSAGFELNPTSSSVSDSRETFSNDNTKLMMLRFRYNSAVFQSLASNDYTIAVVQDSFLNATSFDLVAADRNRKGDNGWDDGRVNPPQNYSRIIQEMQREAVLGVYDELNVTECFGFYDDYWAPQSNALVFVKNESVQLPDGPGLLMYVSIVPRSDDWAKNMWALGNGTGRFVANSPSEPVTTWFLGPPRYEVSHCLVKPVDSSAARCRFEYSPQIMITVCILNILKASVMICVWVMRKWQNRDLAGQSEAAKEQALQDQVIYTLGDAIASFMRSPDATTKDMCLAPREDFLTHRTWAGKLRKETPVPSTEARPWVYTERRWMSAASLKRWAILLFICCVMLAVTGGLLGLASASLRHRKIDTSILGFWRLGFGALTPFTYIVLDLPRQDPAGLISNILIANLPQLLISIVYIFYNAMLSTFLVQREFSLMYKAERRKPLRVSEPMGIQRSTYFISLPLRYGIPLYATAGLMHWLISQSLFLARITAIDPDGQDDSTYSFSTCGYSLFAIFITMLVGLVLVLGIIAVGMRKYDGTMRMVSTNSWAISAACHVLEGDQQNGYLLPVQWGVVEVAGGVGHCAFTTAPAHKLPRLQDGIKYQ